MRSPLSQFQTPTTPRRVVGFFGFGGPAGCPTGLITQSSSNRLILLESILSIVDSADVKLLGVHCQCRFSVHTVNKDDLVANKRNRLIVRVLPPLKIFTVAFCTSVPHSSVARGPGGALLKLENDETNRELESEGGWNRRDLHQRRGDQSRA